MSIYHTEIKLLTADINHYLPSGAWSLPYEDQIVFSFIIMRFPSCTIERRRQRGGKSDAKTGAQSRA
ncbi:hypothetical protein SedNR2807_43920 [Citrobacter sedlakii]